MTIKTKEEIELMRENGKRLSRVLDRVVELARPGVTTAELDQLAERLIIESGGKPSFKGYRVKGISVGYPATMCISINEEVVHGIPRNNRILREGDIVGLDIGMWYPRSATGSRKLEMGEKENAPVTSLCTDMAVTIGIGQIAKEAQRLIDATRESLNIGIAKVKAGATVGDIGSAIEFFLRKNNLGIIRDLAGHGVGYEVHEEPLIPNYGKAGKGEELKEGMVIAIEPMATLGDWHVMLAEDQWTFKTMDNSLGAHFEHTMAVMKTGADVLTK